MQARSEGLAKPLVWEQAKYTSRNLWEADIDSHSDMRYTIVAHPDHWLAWTSNGEGIGGVDLGKFATLELAQSACQADREACLRSMMREPAPAK